MQIYHNPRCTKSRQALSLLEERGVTPEIIKYLEQKPSEATLRELVKKLAISPRELLRKGESVYKELNLANTDLGDDELIRAMHLYPKLIERPIVVAGNRAVIGRPPEAVLELV
ncbi:arsenate reductase (glutaredoxin) [Gilvimarinus sp. SDUM040013]|uniref:Arsenate reductase n=1 Tax=Gilvimarinus gilvus TaxID=3058038 RepID=A0ABU4S3Y7_9GAMM|nr:arsenate reductase (glutaredoxin) [Gilvimarinus sp. SDUM040013]MDO3388800.1 arsenate reductase (glutaredoxin) [Gilvimarinus sp. SDUM040013]MDX6850553.1 arsenate reductase (glutaredoxin) [Gilvimarinus sp. SDUM040013]